ncbi:hypothetical protein PG997_014284 [Apiospora hydei]|uniref:Nuclear GTPase SLIP-GC n=1 Tax=Apiospora hydei TaxID=1337664 RepID=A0ABR1UTG4_9PEZI
MTQLDTSTYSFTFTAPRQGASESSDGILTPRSGSTLPTSIEDRDSRESHGRPRIFSGDVLPSIEPIPHDAPRSLSSGSTSTHARTPSLSLTPPTSSGGSQGRARVSPRSRDALTSGDDADLDSIDARLQDLSVSKPTANPMGMSELADALNHISNGVSSRSARLLTPEAQQSTPATPLPRRGRRRRSSSKINVEIYDVQDEKAPNDRFNEPNFQSAFRNARRLMSDLENTLASSSLHTDPDSTMKRLHQEAKTLSTFHCPPSRTVGFVGDSGVGKSSLLNSLLDCRGLARASNGGAACTCVATEYHFHGRDDFIVEVHRFTQEEVEDQLARLLQAHRNFHLNELTLVGEEREHYEEMARVAQHTFEVMFRNHFRNGSRLTRMTETEGLEMLYGWLSEVSPSFEDTSHTTHNIDDCSNLLARLTSEEVQADGPAEWPFIKKINVYLKAQILSKGLVLVDLPGLRDLNAARRHITERYMIECNEIFAVCIEGRAITDEGVMNVIELARKAKLSNVGIICTRSDDIKSEEAIKDWKGEKARTIKQKSAAAEAVRLSIRDIEKEQEEYDVSDDELSDGEKDEQLRLGRELRRAKAKYIDRQFELKHYLMTCRNEITKDKLRNNYQDRVPNRTLKVFCVSNTEYWDNRNEPKAEALRHLQLSGILSVREHYMEMVSESQRRMAEHYMKHSIPALVHDVDLWVQSGLGTMTAERRQNIRDALNTLEGRLKRDLWGSSSVINEISSSTRNNFRSRIYTPSTVGSHDWNEEAIAAMVGDLTPLWSQLCDSVEQSHEQLITQVEELMTWAAEYLETELDDSSPSILALSEAIEARQCLLERDMETVCEESLKSMDALRVDALSGIRSSFMGQSMEAAYRSCIAECGRGSDSRRKANINRAVRRDMLFKDLLSRFKGGFAQIADKLQEDLQNTVALHLESVRGTLDMVRSENVALESERDPDFRARVQQRVELANIEIKRTSGVPRALVARLAAIVSRLSSRPPFKPSAAISGVMIGETEQVTALRSIPDFPPFLYHRARQERDRRDDPLWEFIASETSGGGGIEADDKARG